MKIRTFFTSPALLNRTCQISHVLNLLVAMNLMALEFAMCMLGTAVRQRRENPTVERSNKTYLLTSPSLPSPSGERRLPFPLCFPARVPHLGCPTQVPWVAGMQPSQATQYTPCPQPQALLQFDHMTQICWFQNQPGT